jgi:hypothetical protein
MDCTEQHILIASAPLQLLVLQLEGPTAAAAGMLPSGRSSAGLAAGSGQRRLVAVRELSMFNVGRPVQDVALVSPAAADMAKRVLRGARGWRVQLASAPGESCLLCTLCRACFATTGLQGPQQGPYTL